MRFKKQAITAAMAVVMAGSLVLPNVYAAKSNTKEVTLIHIGDIHGHTTPRPNLRSDGNGMMEGGLARMYTKIKNIRDDQQGGGGSLLINTGDTTQGSGEALYTRGQALVDVVDMLGVDAFAPGNWEFVYGPERFKEFFGENGVSKRWGALASNLYNTAPADGDGNIIGATDSTNAFGNGKIPASIARVHTREQYDAWSSWYAQNGERILPPYSIKKVGNVNVGIIGCTTRRGPQVVGSWVVDGIEFTDCIKEVPTFVAELRAQNVDVVALITEIEVGVNIEMVRENSLLSGENYIDVILNSDMHEETTQPIEITTNDGLNKTLLIEEGQDGTMLGELNLVLSGGHIQSYDFTAHTINESIKEDKSVAKKVAEVRAPFTDPGFGVCAANPVCKESKHKNSFSGTYLQGSLDSVVGTTAVDLHRSNFSHEDMPAVLEGTSHDFVADAIRWWAESDIATVRGFRYGQHIAAGGNITRNDLYHIIPIGARVGKAGRIHANQIRNQVDNSSQAVFASDPGDPWVRSAPYNNMGWAGGWMFAYSGDSFHVDFDPYWFRTATGDSRARGLQMAIPCDKLPTPEQVGCVGKGITTISNSVTRTQWYEAGETGPRPGAFTANWAANLPAPVPTWALQTDPPIAPGQTWGFKAGSAAKQHQLPAIMVAGYWYEQSPFKLNNCPNCNPVGLSNDDESADAPYILPVNMDPATGGPMLDTNGKPMLKRDGGVIVRAAENRPVADGEPIELVEVIAKYLAATGPANPVQHRVTPVSDGALPDYTVSYGHPVMQPLCGTIPKDYASIPKNDAEAQAMALQKCWE